VTTPGTGGLPERRLDQQRTFSPPAQAPGAAAGVVRARIVIVSGGSGVFGVFVYSGTPGAGNLVASLAGAGTTADPFGNPVLGGGLAVYGTGGQEIFLGLIGAIAELEFRTGAAIEGAAANMASEANGAGAAQTLDLLFSGPRLNVAGSEDWVQLQLSSNNPGGTQNAQFFVNWISTLGAVSEVAAFGETGLALFNAVSTPLSFSNLAGLFAAAGVLKFVSGSDGSTYDTARLTQMLQGTYTTTSTTPQVPSSGIVSLSASVAAAAYRWKAHVIYTGGQNAGTVAWAFSGPAATFGRVQYANQLIAGGAITWSAGNSFTGYTNNFNSNTLNTANPQVLDAEGQAVFSASGTLALTVAEVINGDTAVIGAGSWLEVFPI
jgi:hypothetical protein